MWLHHGVAEFITSINIPQYEGFYPDVLRVIYPILGRLARSHLPRGNALEIV